MKKLIFSLAAVLLLVCTSIMASSQLTNKEIYDMISRSKEANQNVGVFDPNLIYPGQSLTFLFSNGVEKSISVVKGDNQWTIVRDKISQMEKINGPVVNYPEPKPGVPQQILEKALRIPLWAYVLLIIVIVAIFAFVIYTLSEKSKNVDPVTAGDPQVKGGVNDAKAYDRMGELAGQRFPGATLVIKNIRRGLLSGKANVYYANAAKPKKITLKSVHAYAGEISVNGHIETIYFLQGCGNDARIGNYMTGGEALVFVPDVIVNEDGSTTDYRSSLIPSIKLTPAPVDPVVKTETASETAEDAKTEPTTPVVVVHQGSEFFQNTTNALAIVGKFLEGNETRHKVTLKVTKDSVEAVIENNNRGDQPKAQKNANEKE